MTSTPVLFAEVAATLAANGYKPVPIKPGTKRPPVDDWQHFKFAAGCETRFEMCGAGVLTGDVIGVDVDVDCPDAAAAIEQAVYAVTGLGDVAAIPRRLGRAPRVLLPLRAEVPFRKLRSADFTLRSTGSSAHVEILADGQQFVAYHLHPGTGRPYEWNGGGDLLQVPRDALPEVDEAKAREIIAAAEAVLEEWGDRISDEPAKGAEQRAAEGPTYAAGKRNDALTREAGRLRRLGLSTDELAAALLAMNRARCRPPLDDAEVRSIAASIGKKPAAESERARDLGDEPALPIEWAGGMSEAFADVELIEGLFAGGALIVVYGSTGSGKTFLTLDLGCHVAAGLACYGRRVRSAIVVYVAAEAGPSIRNRLIAWRRHHKVDELSLAAITVPVDIRAPVGDADRLMETAKRIAREHGAQVGLIIIDTLSRAFGGGDENSSVDMGSLVANVDLIRHATGAAVLLVHHAGKDVTKGARGHSLLRAAADVEIEVVNEGGTVTASVTKHRDGVTGGTLSGRLRPVEIGANSWGEPLATCVLEPAGSVRAPRRLPRGCELALRALRDALAEFGDAYPGTSSIPRGTRAVHGDLWRRAYAAIDSLDVDGGDPKETAKAKDARLKRFTRARKALQEAEIVAGVNDLWWTL